ncbi:MAG: hypothetical protein HC887_00220 [Desulfobacteraceae bacterium]|nr:hypothetical protein [Desulfobacteraceae bacterium]
MRCIGPFAGGDFRCLQSSDRSSDYPSSLLFSPLKRIDLASPVGKMIGMAIHHRLAIVSAHTNLDSAAGGINDILAEVIGLKDLQILTNPSQSRNVKLVVYVPSDYEQKVLNALFETDAGKIGEYSRCSFRVSGTGTFLPGEHTDPFIGKKAKSPMSPK